MKINSIRIGNCKSYREITEIYFDNSFNVLVGPNGGGKSNTLDIITILIRNYFLPSYKIQEINQHGTRSFRINQENTFRNIQQHLDKFSGLDDEESIFEVQFLKQDQDLQNIQTIVSNIERFKSESEMYEQTPLGNFEIIENWDISKIENQELFTYNINNWSLRNSENDEHRIFYEYLKYLPLFSILCKEISGINLHPTFLYFSPYRGAKPSDLQANLSGNNYYDLLFQYHTQTSQDVTSLIRLASLYFADKMRRFESEANSEGYEKKWNEDDEVLLVSKYMERLGYRWSLQLVDSNRNIYEIELSREGRTFNISQASSGEKEILNFLLGVFAFQIEGGIIIVDEPELHLHPKWQNLLRELFIELSASTNNQFLLSTHSPVFLTPDTLSNIRRLSKGEEGGTQINSISNNDADNKKSLLHIINSHNNERMFFADHVVLVEGIHDRLIFEALLNFLKEKFEHKKIFEVLEVFGKGNFKKYKEFLDGFGVEVSIIGDLDYLRNIKGDDLEEIFITNWSKIDKSVLNGKKSKDRQTLSEILEKAIEDKNFEELIEFWNYVKGRHTVLNPDLSEVESQKLEENINALYESDIYVLKKGEIEAYLPKEFRSLSNTIDLVKKQNFEEWIKNRDQDLYLKELGKIALSILNIDHDEWLNDTGS